MAITLAIVFLSIVCASAASDDLPIAVPLVYLAGSATAFLLYWLDKSAAIDGRRRTPEDTLLVIGLLGGWPGALLAQRLIRHKSSKVSFQVMFWTTVALNCAVLAWFWSTV